ncbi:phosphoglycolate phosphatase/AHBA synthesis associated protein [Nocardioides aurantiacus]|uniref:Phosphoglycolate phosphatase/AHBA synthesis associated protein n=1 Tax=Nocardioides aurantiacus TaxID=86796 RepID=A0A3N2D0L9_9ACTN|nr:phosphoglycolate phosphatase/AHBA synthesis associated protein [Nocardioides aurantiacus]
MYAAGMRGPGLSVRDDHPSGRLLPVSGRDVRAVLWDMDGTLIDSSAIVPDAFVETVLSLGGPRLTRDEVVAYYDAGAPHVMLGMMLDREPDPVLGERYHATLADVGSGVRVHDGVAEVLAELHGRGVPMGVFTGNSARAASILLEAAGLRGWFDAVVGGDEVERPKPAPDGVLRVAQELGVDPARCVYVGDSPLDVGAARDAGAVPLAAGWGHLFDADRAVTVLATPADLLAHLTTVG